MAGALFWGVSNIIVRRAAEHAANAGHDLDMFSLVVWSALIPPLPFLILAIGMERPSNIIDNILHLNPLSIFAVLYLALAATLFGFGSWSRLLARYHAGRIASFSLLVPVAGLATAYLVLDEVFSLTQLIGCFAVLLGMLVAIGRGRDPAA